MAAAKWSVGNPTSSVDADGTAIVSVPLLDSGTLAGTVQFTITSDRALRVDVHAEAGSTPLSDFVAWSAW